MKKILIILSVLFCTTVFAHTIEWYVGDTLLSTTTCESGDNITPPTVPEKFGYHFKKWNPEYTRIEYLESTGTQWIDTGFVPTVNSVMETDYQFTQSPARGTSYQIGAGSDNNATRFRFIIGNSTVGISCSLGTNIDFQNINSLDRHILRIDTPNKTCFIDGYTIQQTNNAFAGSDGRSFYLFNLNNGSSIYKHPARVFYLKFWDNNSQVRDMIPVLDKNGTPCMFDKVEHKFYYNAGTGDFIAGPVIGE